MADNDPTATLRYQLAVEDLDRRVPRMVPVDDGAMCHRTYRDPAADEAAADLDTLMAALPEPHPNDPLAPLEQPAYPQPGELTVAADGLARVIARRKRDLDRRL